MSNESKVAVYSAMLRIVTVIEKNPEDLPYIKGLIESELAGETRIELGAFN